MVGIAMSLSVRERLYTARSAYIAGRLERRASVAMVAIQGHGERSHAYRARYEHVIYVSVARPLRHVNTAFELGEARVCWQCSSPSQWRSWFRACVAMRHTE